MKVVEFLQQSGFKVLALAKLTDCEYSIVLYLLNCAMSGLDHLVTTESELASTIQYDATTVRESISHLTERAIVKVHYGDLTQRAPVQSVRMSFNFDMTKWALDLDEEESDSDQVLSFPFKKESNLKILDGGRFRKNEPPTVAESNTWQRVVDTFSKGRTLTAREIAQTERAAKTLVQVHPVDEILMIVRHFQQRIPTLSLLLSSWQHFETLFEAESSRIDISEARVKHSELDDKVRNQARQLLEKADALRLTEDEATLLEILMKHRAPRRQLFWAHQVRTRYPNLNEFFEENLKLMLPVTSQGSILK